MPEHRPGQVIALVDCNNFYVSCERIFNPGLEQAPVVVLSNNDGCVVARSNEVKSLGIKMGTPAFRCAPLFSRHKVRIFSSNYTLYGDMSQRVMATLAGLAPRMEVYSIDEAFLDLNGLAMSTPGAYAATIRARVKKWTGIPVSIGLGPTKTLAKIANKLAKSGVGHNGVFDLTQMSDPDRALEQVRVKDVWGIGPRYARFLQSRGVKTALDLKNCANWWVKKHLTVTGLSTVLELRGLPCLELEEVPPLNKSIACSRSFGAPVSAWNELREALCLYVQQAAMKMRRQHLEAGYLQVYLRTNPFRPGPGHQGHLGRALPCPTAYTPTLIQKAEAILERIFQPGHLYQKVGVVLSGLEPCSARQLTLMDLDHSNRTKERRLMATLDALNTRYGRGTVRIGLSGNLRANWEMQRKFLSKRFTTSWEELPEAG